MSQQFLTFSCQTVWNAHQRVITHKFLLPLNCGLRQSIFTASPVRLTGRAHSAIPYSIVLQFFSAVSQ
jgi:hypothetical protein